MKNLSFILLAVNLLILCPYNLWAQLKQLRFDQPNSFAVSGMEFKDKKIIPMPYNSAFFSVMIDSNYYSSFCSKAEFKKNEIFFTLADSIQGSLKPDNKFQPGTHYILRFTNISKSSHKIENLVPLGEGPDKVYITAGGTKDWPDYLCRSLLFRPGYGPVGVVLPDNAWHLGFSNLKINDTLSLTGLARRGERDKDKTETDRWTVTLKPGGWMEYNLFFDTHNGDWHEGLRMMFQQRYLYDLPSFDNSLFERKDLQWMKDSYLMLLQFAWDKKYYDAKSKKYTFYSSFSEMDSLTGGYDIFTIWPTWPRLGLDQRNQWDMYRDLPGGLKELKGQTDFLHNKGKHYFISYNPWDEGTRKEDQMKGMEDLLHATGADGVVLDTKGASSKELQATADKVKPGIIMYSEGMAVPKDMPGIVSGRVHDAIVLPPPLNLNKFIKPDFAIFRVLQLADDRLHRELAISFFNGYGVEINTMRPGRPSWIHEEYSFMGKLMRILRTNTSVFHNYDFLPLIPTLTDSIYVNRWKSEDKTIYTIYSLKPEGFSGNLFNLDESPEGKHLVDLWNHVEIKPLSDKDNTGIPVRVDPFSRSFLGTRREGNPGCIAVFRNLMDVRFSGDSVFITARKGDHILVSADAPSYNSVTYTYPVQNVRFAWPDHFDITTEKIVVELFQQNELLDERVLFVKNSESVLISKIETTVPVSSPTAGMAEIPAGDFRFYTSRDPKSQDPFIAFPDHKDTLTLKMKRFFMDIYPVTNRQWQDFISKSGYVPADTVNYLKHWNHGIIPQGEEDYPVVYISTEDAKAYAKWQGKRLPAEVEWQYAAQGTDMRNYPWGKEMDSTRCNYNLNHMTPVEKFPQGSSPFGIMDMTGNVWQLTGDVYDIGCYSYTIIRGGSYYHPEQSFWYVTGGPVRACHPEMLLLMTPGLDRNSTVGFRCVRDAD
ncbi:MAG: formylglycine-generating enzyme family protein [Bacteroidota bacterium]|nr:formylglycine-generating enzyme family protein [Bacteroidota bacterium]